MDRVAAAQERLWKLRRELPVELPCADCRYLWLGKCKHPAVQSYSSDPITGDIAAHPASATAARSATGSCGPEGALFAPKPSWVAGAVGLARGIKASWLVATALIAAAGILIPLL